MHTLICESTAEIDPGAAAANPAAGAEPPTAVRHGRRPGLTGVHGLLAAMHQNAKEKHQSEEERMANPPTPKTRTRKMRGRSSARYGGRQPRRDPNSRFTKLGHDLDDLDAKREMRGGSGGDL